MSSLFAYVLLWDYWQKQLKVKRKIILFTFLFVDKNQIAGINIHKKVNNDCLDLTIHVQYI